MMNDLWLERTGILEEQSENGIKVWGQRTLTTPHTALYNINIRLSILRNGNIKWSPSAGTRRGIIDGY